MTPETLARLHKAAFAGESRPWSAPEFASLLASPYCFVSGDNCGFALGRVIVDEAELLTLATAPAHRRQGHGYRALQTFEQQAIKRGATRAFLEVAADNTAATALYLGAGYHLSGIRPAYYNRAGTSAVDAHIMTRILSAN